MAMSEVERAFVSATYTLDELRYQINAEFRPAIEILPDKDAHTRIGCLRALSIRAVAWLATFRRVDRGEHLQAHFAGVRSLLETLVDMMLVSQDPTDTSAMQMYAWEQSALLEHMKKCEDYYTKASGRTILMASGPSVRYTDWIVKNKDTVLALRKKYLGATTHPNRNRWTGKKAKKSPKTPRGAPSRGGANRTLYDDIEQVETEALTKDSRRSETNPLGVYPLGKTHTLLYSPLNWGTHGSTLALLGRLDTDGVTRTAAAAHLFAAELTIHIFKILLREAGLTDQLDALRATAERVLNRFAPLIAAGHVGIVL